MKIMQVIVPWKAGLHLRPASRLARLAQQSRSLIRLKTAAGIADARSVLAIVLLCAVMGTVIDLEIHGEDESAVSERVGLLFAQEPAEEDSTRDGGNR